MRELFNVITFKRDSTYILSEADAHCLKKDKNLRQYLEYTLAYLHTLGQCQPPALASNQGVTKRCRLSWLTNSALVYEPNCGKRGGCGVAADEYTAVHMEPK